MLFGLVMASSASAKPVEGPAGAAFYTPPSAVPTGSSGELIWYRPTTVNLNVTLPSNKAWDVLYQSTNQEGTADPVTGTVILPTAAWTGKGPRPVVTIGIGTQGSAPKCAPSLQWVAEPDYDGGAFTPALKGGFAFTTPDFEAT